MWQLGAGVQGSKVRNHRAGLARHCPKPQWATATRLATRPVNGLSLHSR